MNSFESDAIAHRMKYRASIAFDAMGKRIGARRSRQFGRQAASKLRIENHEFGEQFRVEDNGFAFGSVKRDDGTAADLAAGACCRGNRNKRSKAGPVGLVVEFCPIQLRALDKEAGGFCDIKRAAAAEADDAIAT